MQALPGEIESIAGSESMRTKKVNRYWCDFCNKAGLRPDSMLKHEKHCTLNPNRECRVCTHVNGGGGSDPERLAGLVRLLPAPVEYANDEDGRTTPEYVAFCEAVEAAIPVLREAAEGCPACMMAALRQAKIPVPMAENFDFKAEMESLWHEVNRERAEIAGYY